MGDERAQAASLREELAWAAGFWDGEGSCGCYFRNDGKTRKASASSLRASVNQNSREALDRFRVAVGVGKIYGPYHSAGRKNPLWSYQLTGQLVDYLFAELWPWLCEPKRQQYLAAKAKFDERPEPSKGGHICSPDCTCGRQKWKTEDVPPEIARRREQQRAATRRYREKRRCTCDPGRNGPHGTHGGSTDKTLMGPSHAADCPMFSTGQEAAIMRL